MVYKAIWQSSLESIDHFLLGYLEREYCIEGQAAENWQDLS